MIDLGAGRVSSTEKHKDQGMCPLISHILAEGLMAEIEWTKHFRKQPAASWVISREVLLVSLETTVRLGPISRIWFPKL